MSYSSLQLQKCRLRVYETYIYLASRNSSAGIAAISTTFGNEVENEGILTKYFFWIKMQVRIIFYRLIYPVKAKISQAIEIFKKNHGILRTQECIKLGIHPRILYEMRDLGILEVLARGTYRLTSVPDFSEPDLVLVSKKIPQGIICLVSALAYYEITTQIPHFVYVAIPNKSRKPKLEYPPIRYFWYSEKVYQTGVKTIDMGGYPVKIFDMEKTLVDCLKFRKKIGMDVVVEALKTYWREKKTNLDKLYEYAKINRVEKILQPIIETIVSQ